METGQMQYNVNGEILTLRQGEGLFVNSKQLHFGYGNGAGDCTFLCVLFHPALLCSSACVEQRFVQPVLENGAMPCQVLRPGLHCFSAGLTAVRPGNIAPGPGKYRRMVAKTVRSRYNMAVCIKCGSVRISARLFSAHKERIEYGITHHLPPPEAGAFGPSGRVSHGTRHRPDTGVPECRHRRRHQGRPVRP
ncbi:hypothetical protein B5G12_02950 [Faecalibacterium sp. An58]|nr:hypothetical protein B5G12_02950 [Faecalibacterium sp. An58]